MLPNTPEALSSRPSKGRIVEGIAWVMGAHLLRDGVRMGTQFLLARLLLPEAFGLIGLAVVFTGLIQVLNEMGLEAALVQRKAGDLKSDHLNTAFWSSLIVSLALVLILVLLVAPLAAWMYQEALLQPIIAFLGVPLLLRPLTLIHTASLTRELRFRSLVIVEITAAIVGSVVAVLLALGGGGVWSIVAQSVVTAILTVPLTWMVFRWRAQITFSWPALRDLFSFSMAVTANNILLYVTNNIDYLLIGLFLDKGLLGIYTLAFVLTDVFRSRFMMVLNKVLYPVYGQVQADLSQVKRYYLRAVYFNSIVLFPFMVLFIVLAEPIIRFFFGVQWELAVLPVRIMSLAAIIHTIGGTSASLIRGIGRPGLELRIFLFKTALVTVPAFLVFTYLWGINGAALAVLVHKLASRVMYQHFLRRLIGVTEIEIFQAVIRPAGAASLVLALVNIPVLALIQDGITLIAVLVVSLGLYSLIVWGLIDSTERREVKMGVKRYWQRLRARPAAKVNLPGGL